MTPEFARGMSRATALTRDGKLFEATALIQSLFHPAPAPQDTVVDPDVIEGTFTRVAEGPARPEARKTDPQASETTHPPRKPRKGLAQTLRDLAAGGRTGPLAPAPAMPDGAQFLALSHHAPQGSRDYRLYVPAALATGPMPLVVMLHGCTQSPEDFAAGTGMNALAEEFGCLVAYPAQPQGANAQKCWNWFRPEDQARGRGEPAVLAGIVADILRDHPVDPGRVYVAGLSAGGAAAAIMAAAYPELFAAVGVHSGLPVGAARDVPSALAAMRNGATGTAAANPIPTIVFHGLADSTVHPRNGAAVVAGAMQGQDGVGTTRASAMSGGRRVHQTRHLNRDGRSIAEYWEIEGAGHAWAGGQPQGSHTDARGPDASREMLRFFLQHRRG